MDPGEQTCRKCRGYRIRDDVFSSRRKDTDSHPAAQRRSLGRGDANCRKECCLNADQKLSAITGMLSAVRRNDCPRWTGISITPYP
jgi:hypothetical protein